MAEFENYKEVAFLLSKAVQGQLTEKEEETLGKWRQEFPENELLYRRVLTSEFILSKSKQWEQFEESPIVSSDCCSCFGIVAIGKRAFLFCTAG